MFCLLLFIVHRLYTPLLLAINYIAVAVHCTVHCWAVHCTVYCCTQYTGYTLYSSLLYIQCSAHWQALNSEIATANAGKCLLRNQTRISQDCVGGRKADKIGLSYLKQNRGIYPYIN